MVAVSGAWFTKVIPRRVTTGMTLQRKSPVSKRED